MKILITKVLVKSFMNEDLVENQVYDFEQDYIENNESIFTFMWNNHKVKFKGSIEKVYNDDEASIYLTDISGGIIKFSFSK